MRENVPSPAYLPGVGVFTQPDPLVGSPLRSDGFNRYAYCLNNPLKYTDPSGLDPWEHEMDSTSNPWEGTSRYRPEVADVDATSPAVTASNGVQTQAVAPDIPHGGGPTAEAVAPAAGTAVSGSQIPSPPGFVDTPAEVAASAASSWGTGELSQGARTEFHVYETGNVDFPTRVYTTEVPTAVAKAARWGGAAVGVGFLGVDEWSVYARYRAGGLRRDQFVADAAVVGVGGLVVVGIGLTSLPVWTVVLVGAGVAGVVGGAKYEIEHDDYSGGRSGRGLARRIVSGNACRFAR